MPCFYMTFDPSSPTWTKANALFCLESCAAVYNQKQPWSVEDCGKFIHVCWQGSKTIEQWLNDVKTWQVDLPGKTGIKVEAGFWREYMMHASSVNDAVDAIIVTRSQPLPLVVSGHSLGGSLGHIFASQTKREVKSVYTFGKPRIWNKAGADWYNARFKRISYDFAAKLDVVTRMPVFNLIPWQKFAMDGTRILLQGDGKYSTDPSLARRLTLDAYWLAHGWAMRKLKSVEELGQDHHLTVYRPLVQEL